MPANHSSFLRVTGLLTGAILALCRLHAADADSPAAGNDPFPALDNFITFTGRNAWVSGNPAAFQTETKSAKNGTGGIENFQLNKDLSKDVTVKSDGHALAGAEDYLAHFNIAKDQVGSVDAGYKRFRTFYDGIGGFFPSNNAWMPLLQQNLYTDRAKLWVEGTINVPDKPVVTLRYTNELRNGRKDTTIWGDSDFTGIPILSNSNLADRKIIPGYINLGERHQIIEGLVKHTVGKTTYELNLVEDLVDNLDTRYLFRDTGELKPFPAIPATPVKVISAAVASSAISGIDQEGISSNSFSAIGKTETVVSDKFSFHTGLRYEHLTSYFTGNRPIYTSTATAVGVVIAPSANFQNLAGGSKVIAYAANAGIELKPFTDFRLGLDLKGENRYTKGADDYTSVAATVSTATGAITSTPTATHANSRVKETAWTPEINAHYTGIRNISLYASADYRYVGGDDRTTPQYTTIPAVTTENVRENHGHYTVGANWAPCTFFSLRFETFYKDHQNGFLGYASSFPGRYAMGYRLYGEKVTATVNPLPSLSFTTRYIQQAGQMDVTTIGNPGFTSYAKYDSMDTRSYQIDETVDWTPIKQFYLQANINVVFDSLSTVYPRAGGASNDVLHNADNNYWNGSALAGYALDNVTNAEAEFTYYRANNYQPSLVGMQPYGAGGKDYTITAGLKRKLTDHLIVSGKIGYLVSRNDTTGDFTNYTARVAYLSLEHAF